MEQFVLNLLQDSSGALSYALVFAILIACGLGVPLPEDVSLILGGFLVHEGKAALIPMMVVGYLGIICGDSLIFNFGRRIGSRVGQKPGGFFARIVTPEKRARVEGLFKKHGEKIIMLARFMPGVRAVTYFTAGSVRMKYSHFLLFDFIAALASAPGFVYLGFRFGDELDELIAHIRRGERGVLIALLALGVLGFFIFRWRARQEARRDAEALAAKAAEEALQATTLQDKAPSQVP